MYSLSAHILRNTVSGLRFSSVTYFFVRSCLKSRALLVLLASKQKKKIAV